MEQENSKDIDISYGVDQDSESAEVIKKKSEKSPKETDKKKKTSTAKKQTPGKKPSLISEINEMKANNETRSPEFTKKMSQLEEVLGVDQINPFGTNELDVFEEKLKGMTESDLQNLAYDVGLNPYLPAASLKGSLRAEFKSYNRNSMRNAMPTKTEAIKLDPNNPKHKKTLDILGEI
jgi:hypothetical protein